MFANVFAISYELGNIFLSYVFGFAFRTRMNNTFQEAMPYLAIERVLLSINSYLVLWYLLRSSYGTSLLGIPVSC